MQGLIVLEESQLVRSWGRRGQEIRQFPNPWLAIKYFYDKKMNECARLLHECRFFGDKLFLAICFQDDVSGKRYEFIFDEQDVQWSLAFEHATQSLDLEMRRLGIMAAAGISMQDEGVSGGLICGTREDLLTVCELYYEVREEGRGVGFKELQKEVGFTDLVRI